MRRFAVGPERSDFATESRGLSGSDQGLRGGRSIRATLLDRANRVAPQEAV
jgi:hypothetical protein